MTVAQYITDQFGTQRKVAPKTLDGFMSVLTDMNLDIRRNTRSIKDELLHTEFNKHTGIAWYEEHNIAPDAIPPDGWVDMNELDFDGIRTQIRENFVDDAYHRPYKLSSQAFREYLNAAIWTRQKDPVREWIETLPPWDKHERIHMLFVHYLNADLNEVATEAAKRFMLGAIHRTFTPGCIHDWIPVLVGPQGAGKSSFVRALVPPDRRSWYEGNVNLADSTQKKIESVGDALIVEFSELRGAKSANIEGLKTFLSLPHESVRLSYRRNSAQILRRWVGIGTANNDGTGVLPYDPTGTRRFVTIDVAPKMSAAAIRSDIDKYRDQIWAEALYRFRSLPNNIEDQTSSHTLPNRVVRMAERQNNRHITVDTTEEDAALQLTDTHASNRVASTVAQLLVEAGLSLDLSEAGKDRSTQRRLVRHLKNLGWVSKREMIDTTTATRWYPPIIKVAEKDLGNVSFG